MEQATAVTGLIRPTPFDFQIVGVAELFDGSGHCNRAIFTGNMQHPFPHRVDLVRMGVVLHIEKPALEGLPIEKITPLRAGRKAGTECDQCREGN